MYEQKHSISKRSIILDTTYGKVKGLERKPIYNENNTYYAFEGIPYAKPPINELRFRAPQPPEPWNDVLDCTYTKSKPLQKHFTKDIVEGSEDCLYLNIYAKTLNSEKPLPVMVWIYGGSFQKGDASRNIYAPDYFMQKDVILVTLNYRLGALGFLSLNDPDVQVPGNAGIKDQVMALKWIKQNIEYFNGDCNNITMFGESAGGASIHLLMMTPQTKGLFRKAILQSGTILCQCPDNTPYWGYKFACYIGYKGNNNDKEIYDYLSKQDPKKLIINDSALLGKQQLLEGLVFSFGPVVEPYESNQSITTKSYQEMLPSAWGNEIPAILGGNSFEGLFYFSLVSKNPFLVNDITDFVNFLPDDVKRLHHEEELKEMALKIKHAYFGGKQPSVKETLFEYMDLMSYKVIWHGIFRAVRARTYYASQTPTYCYLFDFDSPFFNQFRIFNCGPQIRGVSHADDISYLFYNINAQKLPATSKEYKCIQRMVGMWYNFALSSNPNCKEIEPVKWHPVGANPDNLETPIKALNISDDIEFKDLALHSKLQLWNNLYTRASLI